jgi:hypothetical protein
LWLGVAGEVDVSGIGGHEKTETWIGEESMMGKQQDRQAARREARAFASARRKTEMAREARLVSAAAEVMAALRERDAAITATEHRAGEALNALIETEGLPVEEAIEWTGGVINAREVTRLRAVVAGTGRAGPNAGTAEPA